jgi:hypothetical protein
MDGFAEGYEFFSKMSGSYVGGQLADGYVGRINEEITKLSDALNGMKGFKTPIDQLKGNAAEYWQAGTYNIKAAVNDSSNRATVLGSNEYGSVDIGTSWGDKIGMKYYKNGVASAKQQAKSIFETFKEYESKGGKDSFEKYCKDRNIPDDSLVHDPVYSGQIRLIPSDQIKDATAWLEKKIAENELTRPEQVKRYRETLSLLKSKIEDGKGNSSIELTTEESRELARLAEDGDFDPSKWGLSTEELIGFRNVMQQAFKAGLTSAIVSMVIKTAPELMKAIKYLIETGEIDVDEYKQIGISAAKGAAEGFICGAISNSLVTCCKAGLLGNIAITADPTVIGMVSVVAFDAIKNSYKVAKGEMTRYAMTNYLVRDLFVGTCVLAMGAATQYIIRIPMLGYMIGSFIGSALGSVAYQAGYSATMSFCIDTGFTMFGLVEQNYKLPKDVMQEIGIEVFEYETYEYEDFERPEFECDRFEPDRFEVDTVDITFIRRGVIGVSQIGYVTE